MAEPLETIASFTDLTRAQYARATLEASGIRAVLHDENLGTIDWSLLPALGGVRLLVESAESARAREVLESLHGEADEIDDPEEQDHVTAARRRKRLVVLVTFLIILLPVVFAIIAASLG